MVFHASAHCAAPVLISVLPVANHHIMELSPPSQRLLLQILNNPTYRGCPMPKKRTVSMRAIGYLLLMGGLLLLTGQACVFLLSLNNVVSPPPPSPAQPALTSASVENGMVYFTANEGISALRASDGKQIWHIQRFLIDAPIVAGGVIYARDFGDIFALRGSDGTQLWQYPFFQQPNAQAQPVQVIGDRVYVY